MARISDSLSFKVSGPDSDVITEIAQRAAALDRRVNGRHAENSLHHRMNITACHANGNPLRLNDLLAADDFNFAHDIFGIDRHINRLNGKLENCFSPRFSVRQTEAA